MSSTTRQPTAPQWIFKRIVSSTAFTAFIIGIIVFAGILVGVETFPELALKHAETIHLLNRIVLAIFTLEIVLKISAEKSRPWRYFQDGWNLFDFTIVAVCFLPLGGSYVAVLRLFRLLRVIRLVTVIPKLQLLVTCTVTQPAPRCFTSVCCSSCSSMSTPSSASCSSAATIPCTLATCGLPLVPLPSSSPSKTGPTSCTCKCAGSDVYAGYNQPVDGLASSPKAMPIVAVLYFVSFVLLGTMIMLNLVIGVIINGMDEAQKELADRSGQPQRPPSEPPSREATIQQLKDQLQDISKKLSDLA